MKKLLAITFSLVLLVGGSVWAAPPIITSGLQGKVTVEGRPFGVTNLDLFLSDATGVDWSYSGNSELSVSIFDSLGSTMVRVEAPSDIWIGYEIIRFTATNADGSAFRDLRFTVIKNPEVVLDSVNVEAIYSKAADPGYAAFEDFGDSVRTGEEIRLYWRYNANNDWIDLDTVLFAGMTNGYKVYTVDMHGDGAAVRGNLSLPLPANPATIVAEAEFTGLWTATFINSFSVDGVGADTVGLGTFYVTGAPGMKYDYNEVSAVLHIGPIAAVPESHGDSLCVDTAFYPPGGEWLWATAPPASQRDPEPTWGGPYCWLIIDEATGVENVTIGEKPETFQLNQNYPNPFNPTTTISFDVGRAGHVKLDIYNVLGQRVASLVDRHMERGTYEADWDASSFSTGIYFYKLETENFSDTKKMLLLK
jgi:hypothetical protein